MFHSQITSNIMLHVMLLISTPVFKTLTSDDLLGALLPSLAFVLRHGLTGVALFNLLDLIIHCPENSLSASRHLFIKST